MIWVILTALVAVCGAGKFNSNYLLPSLSAKTAGGSAGALLAPFDGSQGLPTGSFTNDAQGVVVDAVNPGIRTSGLEPTGLGGPRTSYGSKDSKVGDAAFGFSGSKNPGLTRIAPGFGSFIESDEPQADKASGNSLKFTSDVGLDNGFETDNGISVGANIEAAGGVKAQGESYKGDDGKKNSVSYTAGKGGYKHQGQHLPTPTPIPNEILISLEKNAKEEAAGHVDAGSYTGQKYNDEGDHSSNGAGNNNGRPTIGGGDATSSGSYVSQSGQRPTSGSLVGSYKPGSVGSLSSQGHSAQGFGQVSGNKQSSFGINKDQSGSQGFTISGGSSSIGGQFGQAGSKDSSIVSHDQLSSQTGSSQSTENRFGVQSSKSEGSHAHAHASAGSPVRSPSIHGASAFSSAVAKGSGSASAFASTAPLGSGLKNEYLPPSSSFGSAGQHTHGSISGSDSSAGASFPAPSIATASTSVSGSQTLGSQTHSHTNLPSSGSESASVSGNQHSYGHLNQQQAVPSRFGEGQQATFASSTQKPFIGQQQGSDNSYYYNQPAKPFIIPTPSGQYSIHHQPNVPVSSISQQGSKYPNTPATVATGQYQGTSSSNYNGITQASISPFPSGSSSSSSQLASQSSQFGSKPSTQLGQTNQQTSTQFGSTETHSGHKVQGQIQLAQSGLQAPTQFGSTESHSGHQTQSQTQFGQPPTSQTSDSSKSPTQQYHGTIYQYNKPATTLSGNKYQGLTQFGQSVQQTSTQFGSTETHSGHKVQGQTQLVQSGLQVPTQSGSTETHFGHQSSQTSDSSHSPTQQYHGTIYQYNKPATTLTAQGHKDTSSFAQATATNGKPGQVETDSRFGTQQSSSQIGSQSTFQQTPTGLNVQTSQLGQKPIVSSQVSGSNYQFGFGSGSQFVQKPVTTQGSIISSNTNTQSQTSSVQKPTVSSQTTADFGSTSSQFGSKPQKTQGSSFTYSQSQSSQYEKKPVVSTTQIGTQFGSSSSQFGQNSQSTFGSGSDSTTAKPLGSSYQLTQVGSKPATTQGSSFTYTQSQTSQFGKKPVVSTTQTDTQFGSGSQIDQNSQSTVGTGLVSTTAKPFGFQFGQNSQSSQGSGVVSAPAKPFGSSYQQTQFGSKPQTTQGSSYTFSQATSQTSQFGKKPVISITQTGTQFGSGSQFGQNSQSTGGAGSVSSTVKPAFGSSYQQTQFGSKPTTTGSSFTYTQGQTSQFGKKPVVSTTQTGTQFGSGSQFGQNSQFGSSASQFGQNSQSTFGSGSVSTTAKPIGSSYQQTASQFGQNVQSSSGAGSVSTTAKPAFGSSYQPTQFGSKPSTTQGSSYTYTQSQSSQFGKKPVVSTTQTGTQFGSGSQFGQNSQFGSSASQFGQNSQSTFGSGSVSTTAKPIGSSYQQTGSQFGQNVQSSLGAGSVSTTVKPAFGSAYQPTQFGSKPSTTQGSSYTYTQSQTSQFGKKPVISTTQTGTQFGSGSQFGQNSQSTVGAGSVSSTVKPAFGSTYQQTQFGSKPTTTGSSFTYTQGQTSQFGKKPVVSTTQTGTQFGSGSQFGQNSQFGSSASQFGQNSQSTFGSGSVSTTAKPIGSSYQQTASQFGQNVQSSSGAGSVSTTAKPAFGSSYQPTQFGSKPSTTQGSSYTYTQSQSSQFGKKPVVSTTQTGTQFGSGSQFGQNSQFGSSASQFGQNSQSTFGSGSVSTTAKPIGSSYQQTGSQFGENVQSSLGAGSVSTTVKPAFGSSYQPTQFGSKPSTTQGSSYTYTQSQTSQFGKKPVISTTQTGTQFGSGSQFGQNSQSTVGAGSVSSTVKPAFGSTYQQTQFGSKPTTTGSSFTYTQGQTSQFGKKPVVSTTQTGAQQTQLGSSSYQLGQNSQSTFGSGSVSTTAKPIGSSYQQTGSQFGENVQSSLGAGSVSTTVKPAFGSSYQPTQFGSKPSTTQGSSYTYTQSQTSQFGKKPVISTTQTGTQFGSGSQFGQNSQSTVGAGSVSSTVKPAFGSTYQQTQFGSKPTTTGSSFTYTQGQTSQFGKKPVVSTTQTGAQQTQFGSSSYQLGQNSQSTFGSGSVLNTAKPIGSSYQQTGSQFGQNVQSSLGAGSVSTTVKPAFGSAYQPTQFGSKPSTTQGSSYTYTQSQTSQFGKKPVVSTTQTGTQFGSGSQFGQNSQSTVGAGSVSSTVKPAFGSTYQQTQFGSKPTTTGSSFTYTQGQTSQFGKKPVVSTTQTGTQFGSGSQFGQNSQFGSSSSQFGQHSQSTFGTGSVSTTAKPVGSSYQQTGSQFGQNSQSTGGAGSVSSTVKPAFGSSYQQTQFGSKPTTTGSSFTYTQGQTSQFGKKPVVSATQTGAQQTQFGSSSYQLGQNSQSTFGSGSVSTTAKPIGSSYQQTGSQFGQNVQYSLGAGSVSTTVKPAFGSSYQQTQFGYKPSTTQGSSYTYTQSQTSQFGKKPVVSTTQTGTQFGSGSQFGQNSQFGSSGSQIGQTSQSTFGSSSVSTTAKPIGSSFQQTQFGSKPSTTQGSSFTYTQSQTSQFGKKPVVSTTQTGSQFGSGSQFGQNSQSTQDSTIALTTSKPVVGIKPVYQQAQFGSIDSQFIQKPQTTQGSSFTSNTYSHSQTSQFGKKPETGSAFQQTQFGSTGQLGQKPVITTVTGVTSTTGQAAIGQKPSNTDSYYQQSQFGSTGSQFVQKPQSATQGSSYSSNIGSAGEAVQTTQFGVAGSSQITGSQGSTQFGSTPSRFGESSQTIAPIVTISQIVEPTQFIQKPFQTPFGSSITQFGQKPHVYPFASSSGSNVVPFSSTQTGQVSKYETSKFGVQNQGVVSSTQKPVGSSLSQTNYQQYQYTQSSDKSGSQPQFGQGLQSNVGSGQIGQTTFGAQVQKPFGSTQTTYEQTQFTQGQKPFGSSLGSGFQIGGLSIGDQPTQGTVQTTSVTGYNYKKPQSVSTTQYGSQSNGVQDQKVQQSQTNFNSAVSTVQTPINGQTFKPLGVPSTQGSFQPSQSTVSSSLFGVQAVKPTDFSGPVIQTSYNKFSGKPFQPASTVSTQGSNVQSQSSAVSTSLFGLKPTPSTELAHFSGKPEYSIIPSYGVDLPSVVSSTQSPSRVGSNEGLVVSTVQTPIVPVPGYELVINEGTSINQGLSHSFGGLGEQFGGPRDPPRFDEKTGYHY